MSTDGEARPVHRRISKACEPCRRKKAKCDGNLPVCALCASRGDGASCHYRDRPRNRKSRNLRTSLHELHSDGFEADLSPEGRLPDALVDFQTASDDPSPDNRRPVEPELAPVDVDVDVDVDVNAAQSQSQSQSQSQLYYGPSSNFAFLQHIHQTFSRPDAAHQSHVSSLDRFKYRDRFFPPGPAQRTGSEKAQCLFLPEYLARQFLDLFMGSIWYLSPFFDRPQLVEMLDNLYRGHSGARLGNGGTAAILLCLACGATLTEHSAWVDTLMEQALAAVPSLDMVITVKSVQISMLLVHVQVSCGRHNMAYIQIGAAARKAFAAGMHKDANYQMSQYRTSEQTEARRVTFWSLVFIERWFSFWLGRPSMMDEAVIDTPLPETSPLIRAMGALSNIINHANSRMYNDYRAAPTKLWQAAQDIRQELFELQGQVETALGFRLDGAWETAIISPDRLFITNFFYHTFTITFRPFLIMSATRIHRNPGAGERVRSNPGSGEPGGDADLPVDMWWLPKACQIAADSARHFISFFALAVGSNPIIRGLSFTTAYVESAACLLFYDSLRNHKAIESNSAILGQALKSLKLMNAVALVPGVVATVEQIVNELEQVRSSDDKRSTASATALDLLPLFQNAQLWSSNASTLPQTQVQSFNHPFNEDSFDINWSYALPYDLGFEQGLFAPDLGEYFDVDTYPTG